MKYFVILVMFFLAVPNMEAQKKQKETLNTDTTSTESSVTGNSEEMVVNQENLEWLGFGPRNYRNLFLRLSTPLEGKQISGDVTTNNEGKVVFKKRPNLKIRSEDRAQVTAWTEANPNDKSWVGDKIQVSFSLKGESAGYCVLWFVVREWGGDETTAIVPDSKESDNSMFYIATAEGKYSFGQSSAESRLIFDLITEDQDDPSESQTRKPGESTGGKISPNKWSNKGMTIGDL